MYVCICNGLTEARVREAARESGERRSAKAVYRRLGCEARCGLCLPYARRVIAGDDRPVAGAGSLSATA